METNVLHSVIAPNTEAGARESKWIAENAQALERYQGKWIAVLGEKVLVEKPSIGKVYEFLKGRNIGDALVIRIPNKNGGQHRYRIAYAADRLRG